MDDFRVGNVPLQEPYRHEPAGADERKRRRHPRPEAAEEDVVTLSDETGEGVMDIEDVYTPSKPEEESQTG